MGKWAEAEMNFEGNKMNKKAMYFTLIRKDNGSVIGKDLLTVTELYTAICELYPSHYWPVRAQDLFEEIQEILALEYEIKRR